ncbi:helix-turn-helix domain-containing protein [Dethiosulfovibrio salsuginis]|uniref:helix-turn-helix domain-containing protein n=1 Tax=Dethiosulfovibrio salsuginis TaxID=561720 RepID=UPI002E0F4BCB
MKMLLDTNNHSVGQKRGEIMLRAYKYRIYPNMEQKSYFARCFGCVRFIYKRV